MFFFNKWWLKDSTEQNKWPRTNQSNEDWFSLEIAEGDFSLGKILYILKVFEILDYPFTRDATLEEIEDA